MKHIKLPKNIKNIRTYHRITKSKKIYIVSSIVKENDKQKLTTIKMGKDQ